ncbi:MAG: hypothetical protein ACRCTS_09380 [Fusobacteriaceae bacterium]
MSIEVYIDNEKIELKKRYKTLGKAIIEINAQLIKESRLTTHILVNGEELSEKTFMYAKKNILEFKTKKESGIVFEGIYNMKKFSERYFDLVEEIGFVEEHEEDEILQEMMDLTSWFIKYLIAVKSFSTIDMRDNEFDKNLDQLQDLYMDIKQAFEQGDMEVILEILEFEVPNVLTKIEKKADDYAYYFLNDQKSNKFLN